MRGVFIRWKASALGPKDGIVHSFRSPDMKIYCRLPRIVPLQVLTARPFLAVAASSTISGLGCPLLGYNLGFWGAKRGTSRIGSNLK